MITDKDQIKDIPFAFYDDPKPDIDPEFIFVVINLFKPKPGRGNPGHKLLIKSFQAFWAASP